jgi:hypothetical protein
MMKIIKIILIYIIGTISFLAAMLDLYNGLPVIKKMIDTAMTTVSGETTKPNSNEKFDDKHRSNKKTKKTGNKTKLSKIKSRRKYREATRRKREQKRIDKLRREREEKEREAVRYERARQRLEKAKQDLEQERLEVETKGSTSRRYDDFEDSNDQPVRPHTTSPSTRSIRRSPLERLKDSRNNGFDEMGDELRRRR